VDLAGRLIELGLQGLTDRALRAKQLKLIATRVSFDGHVFAMTDPSTGVITSPHALIPMIPQSDLPHLIRRRYAAGGVKQWHAILAEFGIHDAVTVPLNDRWGSWGLLELWREDAEFSELERSELGALAPGVTESLRMAVARTFTMSQAPSAPLDSGVVLLDHDLQVRSLSSGAEQALMQLLPPTEPVPPVPAAAYNAGAALLAYEEGTWPGEPWSRVHLGANRWATVRAERLEDGIAVHIGPSSTAERVDLFARSSQLTSRETQVLRLALQGMDTRAMANALVIAHTTAEDHLKALLAKTGSVTRHQLLARALGG
jgi:DNA-binding CsgD family transcriptional regulator